LAHSKLLFLAVKTSKNGWEQILHFGWLINFNFCQQSTQK
jgi:hypothetical protein